MDVLCSTNSCSNRKPTLHARANSISTMITLSPGRLGDHCDDPSLLKTKGRPSCTERVDSPPLINEINIKILCLLLVYCIFLDTSVY